MSEEGKKTSSQLLKEIQDNTYARAWEAKEKGEPVVWATSICPDELLNAMDLATVYPENQAGVIGARKEAMKFIDQAEGVGYGPDTCSYARVNMGYVDLQQSDSQEIPLPDLIFSSTNICYTVQKWYENLAKKLNIPLILFDMPFNHEYEVTDSATAYIRGQLENAIKQLEEFTGRKMDYDKLAHAMEINNETCEWWKKATDMGRFRPSPLDGFKMFNYMALMVANRSFEDSRDCFRLWYEELEQRHVEGKGPWSSAEEQYRIIWDGIACWPHLSTTYKLLKKYGINMVTSTYPQSWYKVYETNDLDGMARSYTGNYANRNLDFGEDSMEERIRNFDVDGVLFHTNRSCKLMDFRTYEVQRRILAKAGCPSVVFDGDQTDPRVFSEGQYETRVQALMEMMDKYKEQKRKGDL